MKINSTHLTCKGLAQAFASLLLMFISLSLNAQLTYRNPEAIYISGDEMAPIPGKPYPSSITIADVKGMVSGLTLTLYRYQHTNPDALDILLVAPDGTNAIVLSDVGGATDIEGIDIVLDDAAATNLPDYTTFTAGTYKPTNMGFGPDTWPAPAPAASGQTALSTFNGIDPNGTWSLYVINDLDGAYGSFEGGWSIAFNVVKNTGKKVKITDFTAAYNQQQDEVSLKWSIDGKSNVRSFVIERSVRGSGWQAIGEVDAAVFAANGTTYQFTDANIEDANYLYRIKAVEKDQSSSYSKIVSVSTVGNQITYTVYPNPAGNYIFTGSNSKAPEKVVVKITDMNGNLIIQQKGEVSSTAPLRIDLSSVVKGTYYLIITTNNNQFAEIINVEK